jgi:multidrug transporter EmrE-like cation transporter
MRHQPLWKKMGTLFAVMGTLGTFSGAILFFVGYHQENDRLRFFGLIYFLVGIALILIQRAIFHIGQMDA